MNLGRIIGVVLSILFALSFVNNKVSTNDGSNLFNLIGDSKTATNNEVNYSNVSLSEDNSSDVEVIKYTNNQPYAIDIKANDVNVTCIGSIESDVAIVEKNMNINALFSKQNSNEKTNSIKVNPRETINVYVVSEYSGEFPLSEVSCNYRIDIQDF